MVPFTENTAVVLDHTATRSSGPVVHGVNKMNKFYLENRKRKKICMRNLMNMFENRTVGSRPMYRDDILFNGDVRSLVYGLKVHIIHTFTIYASI